MRGDGRGFPLPQNMNIEGYRCLLVYIPDDDQCLYNMHGAYHELTKWLNHEREETKSGVIMAETWKEAYELTMECGWQRDVIMACDNAKFDELIAAIAVVSAKIESSGILVADAIEALVLTVTNEVQNIINNNVEVAASDVINNIMSNCVDCGDIIINIEQPSGDYDPNNPPVGADESEFLAKVCADINFVYDQMIETYDQLAAYGAGITGIGVTAVVAILAASGIGIPLVLLVGLIEILAGIAAAASSALVRQDLIEGRDGIVCAIYDGLGASDALALLNSHLGQSSMSSTAQSIVLAYYSANVMNQIYGASSLAPPGYPVASGCGCDVPLDWERVYGSNNSGNFEYISGTMILAADWTRAGGDDQNETAAGGEDGNEIFSLQLGNKHLSHVEFDISVQDRTVGCEGQTIEIYIKNWAGVEVLVKTWAAPEIGDTVATYSIDGDWECLSNNTSRSLVFRVVNNGYPADNQLQAFRVYRAGAVF